MTLIFLGIFLVWLPGPSAGLRFIGLEMGEWTKFLGVDTRRNWFYLPPLTTGFVLVWLTWGGVWAPERPWLQRAVGVAVSFLVFPALEDITGPVRHEYVSRVYAILVVLAVAVCIPALKHWRPDLARRPWLVWAGLLLAGLLGLLLPGWIYLLVRPAAGQVMDRSLGFGPGFFANLLGHLWIIFIATRALLYQRR